MLFRNDVEITYYINPDKRTVTAIMEGCHSAAILLVRRHSNSQTYFTLSDRAAVEALAMPNKLIATVKCADVDTFDPEVGKKLAKQRVVRKFQRQRQKAFERYLELLHRRESVANQLLERYRQD